MTQTTTIEDTQSALDAALAAVQDAGAAEAKIMAAGDPERWSELTEAQARLALAHRGLKDAEAAHKAANKQAQADRRDEFARKLPAAIQDHDDAVVAAIEDVEEAIAHYLELSGARDAAATQLKDIAQTLGVEGEPRTSTYAGVHLGSVREQEGTRLAASTARVFHHTRYGALAGSLVNLAQTGPKLRNHPLNPSK